MENVVLGLFWVCIGVITLFSLGILIVFNSVAKNLVDLSNYIKDTENYVKEKIEEILK